MYNILILLITKISKMLHISPQGVERIKNKALFKMRIFAKRVPSVDYLKEYVK